MDLSIAGLGPDSWERWDEMLRDVFVEGEIHRLPDSAADIDVRLNGSGIGPVLASTLETSTSFQVDRSPRHLRRSEGEDFFLVLPVTGAGVAHQGGRSGAFSAGEIFFIDSASPFLVDYAEPMRLITVQVPRGAMVAQAPSADRVTATPISSSEGMGAILGPMLRQLPRASGQLDAEASEALAHNIHDLLATAVNAQSRAAGSDIPATLAAHRRDLHRAQVYLIDRLHDPKLTLLEASTALGFSLRYLHQLFRGSGTTPQRWILAERLARARSLLRQPGAGPVAAVAAATGFKEPSHFSRAFKQRYGRTPGAYRRSNQRSASQ